MKSKSFDLPRQSIELIQNKTYDFANFYKPAAENTKNIGKRKSDESSSKENENIPVTKSKSLKTSKNKTKDKLDTVNVSEPSVDQENLPHTSKKSKKSKTTSTPNVKEQKKDKDINANVKSIMKTTAVADNSLNLSIIDPPSIKPKKRNKSVSFMLDENEETVVKKSKSEQSISDEKHVQSKSKKNKIKKNKNVNENENNMDIDKSDSSTGNSLINKNQDTIPDQENGMLTDKSIKREKKKNKKQKFEKDKNVTNVEEDGENITERVKKVKKSKKKHNKESSEDTEVVGKSDFKSSKAQMKPEVIAQDLENLNIGDNPHTLTNLLDEMAVVDKNKKKKDKKKFNKNKPKNVTVSDEKVTDTTDGKENGEEKEKVKWIKRKWNKDKKGIVSDDKQLTCVIVENLPLKIMCGYKKLLMDHFAKFGIIKQVGVAELYSIEDPEVFTTTINFYSEDAAEKSLEEDNSLFEGSRIRVKRPMPPSQTTLVVRSYSDLPETALSSLFSGAGRIRNVRRLIKGKKSMSTAFVEFDGPKAVKQAMKVAEDVKIEGKKIFVSKYEVRNKNKKQKSENKNGAESDESEE